MAIPIPANRQVPRGTMLANGYRSLITFSVDRKITFWEKTVTPFGVDGGEKIDQTTMHNNAVTTHWHRILYTITDTTLTVSYDPVAFVDIDNLVNVNNTITITLSNGDQLAFYGYLQKFMPEELKDGEQPTATITIVTTNIDPDDGTESPPSVTSATPFIGVIASPTNPVIIAP